MKPIKPTLSLSALLLAASSTSVGAQIWSDEFSSTSLDTTTWNYDLGTGDGGWGNAELQSYTEEAVSVADGTLTITAQPDGSGGYTSGRINTKDNMMFKYGTLIARVQVPDLDAGLWPAMWTMGMNFDTVGWPAAGEIDILEMGQGKAIAEGKVNQRVVSAAHWEHNDGYASWPGELDTGYDLNEGYHIYKLDWTPTFLRTYVDDQMIWEMDITQDPNRCSDCEELHQPHYVVLNMAVGGRFTYSGESSSASSASQSSSCVASASHGVDCPARTEITAPMPAELKFDYIRLYANGDTEVILPELPTEVPVPEPTKIPTAAPQDFFNDFPEIPQDVVVQTRGPTPTPPPVAGDSSSSKGKGKGKGGKSGSRKSSGDSRKGTRSGLTNDESRNFALAQQGEQVPDDASDLTVSITIASVLLVLSFGQLLLQ